jgi:drug/metabolite transporter (DMT)-like permease
MWAAHENNALAIAALIAGYTVLDNAGIERASPIAYLELVLVPVAVFLRERVTGARVAGAAAVAGGVALLSF